MFYKEQSSYYIIGSVSFAVVDKIYCMFVFFVAFSLGLISGNLIIFEKMFN